MIAGKWMNVEQAARYANVSDATIFRACRAKALKHVRVGGRGQILLTTEFIDTWLASLVVEVAAQ